MKNDFERKKSVKLYSYGYLIKYLNMYIYVGKTVDRIIFYQKRRINYYYYLYNKNIILCDITN